MPRRQRLFRVVVRMSQPTPYDRITNFQNDQALAPTDPYPAPKFDQEFNAVKITTDEILQNLSLIQRDDGELANGSVGRDQLDPEIVLGFGAPEPWETGRDYTVGDTTFAQNGFYYCEIAHTSGVFATDLAAGRWSLLVDFTQSTADAEAAAAAAAASAGQAATSATNAATSATNASNSATAAANSAAAASAANAFPWKFDASTTIANPGTGNIRANGAVAAATQLALSALSSVTGNPDVSDWVASWDDSSNPTKGQLIIRKGTAPQNFVVYRVTGAVSDFGSWLQIPVAYVTHSGLFSALDVLNVEFSRTGETGTTTVVGGVGEAPIDGSTYGRKDAGWIAVAATSASGVPFTPAGNIGSTNVQAAIQELDNEKANNAYTPSGNIAAATVPAAIAELDTEKVAKAGDTMSGPLIVTVKGSAFGTPAGTSATAAPVVADANILLYGTGANWAGIGADGSGNMWFRVGLSGSPLPAFYCDATNQSTVFSKASGYNEASLTYGASVAWDVMAQPVATLVLAGNATMAAPTNVVAGRVYTLRIQQNAASTVAWTAANFKFNGGTLPVITAVAGAVDRFTFIGRTGNVLEEIGRAQDIK